jgi:WD40 repeat protein
LATAFLKQFNDGERHESVVVLWDAKKAREHGQLRASPRSPHAESLAFSPDGKLLAGIYGPDLIVWDVANKRLLTRRQISDRHFKSLAFTPDGHRLLTASREVSVRVWDVARWQPFLTYRWEIGNVWCVAVSADGTLAAAGGSTGKVVVWDLD